jgi:hypothetical protein
MIESEGITDNADIIFGLDGTKGKLYIDIGLSDSPWRLVCYERVRRGGPPFRVKYYCNIAGHIDLLAVRLDNPVCGNIIGYHKRLRGRWVAVSADSVTHYYRDRELWPALRDIWNLMMTTIRPTTLA